MLAESCRYPRREGVSMSVVIREGATVLGHYRLEAPLGEGAFSEVWRARDLRLDRLVAIKILKPVRGASLVDRLEREAKILARLDDPHVVRILSVGAIDGRHALVLELVEGQTLRALLPQPSRGGALLPFEQIASLFAQVCAGVAAAHADRIVHRDLKPENVIVWRDERGNLGAKVLDFGLGRLGEASASSAVMTVGTYEYMSPEQAVGAGADLTAASDVFSLGVILAELLSGSMLPDPARRLSWERVVDRQHQETWLGRIRATRPEVPQAVWSLLGRCIAPVDRRYSDAETLLDAWLKATGMTSVPRVKTPVRGTEPPGAKPTANRVEGESVYDFPSLQSPSDAPSLGAPHPVSVDGAEGGRPEAGEGTTNREEGKSVYNFPSIQQTAGHSPIGEPSRSNGRSPDGSGEKGIATGSAATGDRTNVKKWLGGSVLALVALTTVAVGIFRHRIADSGTPSTDRRGDAGSGARLPAVQWPPSDTLVDGCPPNAVRLNGGDFMMGSEEESASEFLDERPIRRVRLSAYCIERTEVSVREYQSCVTAGGCAEPTRVYRASDGLESECNFGHRAGRDNHPINCISWSLAQAYCARRHRGGSLPSEAQWEFAARGASGRMFPWGTERTSQLANLCGRGCFERCRGLGEYDRGDNGEPLSFDDSFATTSPVDAFPRDRTPEGVIGLGGNVREWVYDEYLNRYLAQDGVLVDPRVDRRPSSDQHQPDRRATRGGSWWSNSLSYVRGAYRSFRRPTNAVPDLGFRCVIPVQ